jgi:hypothetical protein
MYTSFSGFGKESFSNIIENMEASDILAIDDLYTKMDSNINVFISQYTDISNNIVNYKNNQAQLASNNQKYHYDDKPDSIDLLNMHPKGKDIYMVVNSDINQLKLYQNSIYVTGVIACATLLIAAIFIGRK